MELAELFHSVEKSARAKSVGGFSQSTSRRSPITAARLGIRIPGQGFRDRVNEGHKIYK